MFDYERSSRNSFRHYVLFATGSQRMSSYLEMVSELSPEPHRSICFAARLESFLASPDPLRSGLFLDHQRAAASILPSRQMTLLEQEPVVETLAQQLVLSG